MLGIKICIKLMKDIKSIKFVKHIYFTKITATYTPILFEIWRPREFPNHLQKKK